MVHNKNKNKFEANQKSEEEEILTLLFLAFPDLKRLFLKKIKLQILNFF